MWTGAAGGARAERWAGKPRADCLPGRRVGGGMWGRRSGLGQLRDDFREPGSLEAGSGGQAPPGHLGPVEEGSARAVGAPPVPCPPSCRSLGSHVNWGLPAPGRASALLVESHNETEEGEYRALEGFAGTMGLGGT